jgi:hypothetical protein
MQVRQILKEVLFICFTLSILESLNEFVFKS